MAKGCRFSLYLFAKEPQPGKVKTRMKPRLDDRQCAKLADRMLRQSTEKVAQFWPGQLVLCVTPDKEAAIFQSLSSKFSCERINQIDADLGGRMASVLQTNNENDRPAVVMGCDVPHIEKKILNDAYAALESGKNIIGLAEDGGFYLLGCQQFDIGLFTDIRWGREDVSHRLLANAQSLGIDFDQLPTLRDIDRYDDLVWLASHDTNYAEYLQPVA